MTSAASKSPRRQAIAFPPRIFFAALSSRFPRMCHDDAETLDPFFCIFSVARFQNKRLVFRENFERFRNVPGTARYSDRSDLVDVDRFTSALKIFFVNYYFFNALINGWLTEPLHDKWAPDKVKYRVRHLLNSRHFPFFSFNCPSITGWVSPTDKLKN